DNKLSNLDIGTETSLNEAIKTITDYLKKELLRVLIFSITSEFRHVYDNNDEEIVRNFFLKYNLKDYYNKFEEKVYNMIEVTNDKKERIRKNIKRLGGTDSYMRRQSYAAFISSKEAPEKKLKMIKDAFVKLAWELYYGGKAWSNIVDGWFMLNDAKTLNDKIIAIDHVYDLQHNTSTIFNKVQSYYKEGKDWSWILKALDKKANIKEIWEIYDDVSPSVKTLIGYVAKSKGYGSLELFLKNGNMSFKDSQIWKGGTWEKEIWKDRVWENGTWKGNIWKNGTWENGTWEKGKWLSGIWENGEWVIGIWYDGIWKSGTWKNGVWYDGTWENGTWENGEWENGTWKNGIWKSGKWHNGTWEDGIWKKGIWKYGKIYSKKFSFYFDSKVNPNEFKELEKNTNSPKELDKLLKEI
ncbi:MAG: hypothetical protein D6834_03785, partial [Aquificota bacterium]